jgi:hypothetical protein
MSSIIGHASIGIAVYLSQARLSDTQSRYLPPLLVLVAIFPDFDYLLNWLFGISFQTRITHSLAFCLTLSILIWGSLAPIRAKGSHLSGIVAFSTAACAHPILDLLVGVHSVPLLWPFTTTELLLPIGLLPSAGHPHFTNYYLWRNLLIECGVLFPFLTFVVAIFRGKTYHELVRKIVLIGPVWLGFVIWSLQIH